MGSKNDLEATVAEEKIKAWTAEKKINFLRTSAKNGENVEEVFMTLSRLVY